MRFEFVGIMKDFPLREPLLCAKLIASNPCNDRGRARTHPARQRDFVIDCDPKRRQRTFPLRCHTLGAAHEPILRGKGNRCWIDIAHGGRGLWRCAATLWGGGCAEGADGVGSEAATTADTTISAFRPSPPLRGGEWVNFDPDL